MSGVFLAHFRRYGPEGPPFRTPTLRQARAYCRRLTYSHYENFLVATLALPARLRPHFHSVYAYCRWADDLADEIADPHRSLVLLDWWEEQLEACYRGESHHPVMVALQDTVRAFGIPAGPFRRLIEAFRQDQRVTRYATFDQLQGYCRNSANPVGELVLYLGGCHTPAAVEYSDSICTGLQLANFCQDVPVDYRRGRIYLPADEMRRFDCCEEELGRPNASGPLRTLLAFQVTRAEQFLRDGAPLSQRVPRWLTVDLEMFVCGGLAILASIRRLDYDVLARRPTVSRWQQLRMLWSARFGRSPAGWSAR